MYLDRPADSRRMNWLDTRPHKRLRSHLAARMSVCRSFVKDPTNPKTNSDLRVYAEPESNEFIEETIIKAVEQYRSSVNLAVVLPRALGSPFTAWKVEMEKSGSWKASMPDPRLGRSDSRPLCRRVYYS